MVVLPLPLSPEYANDQRPTKETHDDEHGEIITHYDCHPPC
jgi:hypothetical protein